MNLSKVADRHYEIERLRKTLTFWRTTAIVLFIAGTIQWLAHVLG